MKKYAGNETLRLITITKRVSGNGVVKWSRSLLVNLQSCEEGSRIPLPTFFLGLMDVWLILPHLGGYFTNGLYLQVNTCINV